MHYAFTSKIFLPIGDKLLITTILKGVTGDSELKSNVETDFQKLFDTKEAFSEVIWLREVQKRCSKMFYCCNIRDKAEL